MGTRRDFEIERLLDEAQNASRCLASKDRVLCEALNRRLDKQLIKPRNRLYARTSYWNSLSRRNQEEHVVRGIAQLHPNWVFCNSTAALLHKLPISFYHLGQIHILAARDYPNSQSSSNIRRHKHRTYQSSIAIIDGIKLTSFEDTLVDCLLEFNFREGLAIADAALAHLRFSPNELLQLVKDRGRNRPGIRQAIQTAQWANSLSESGGESMARAIMIEHGFMVPELQVNIRNANGFEGNWRVDFFWKLANGTTVAGELDGAEKYTNPEMTHGTNSLQVLSAERIRESRITLAVDRVMRFTYSDIVHEEHLVALLERFGIPRVC